MTVPMDIGKVQAFLSGLGQSAGVAQTAADNSPALGAYLLSYIQGSSATSKDGFDGILAALTAKWSGDAADAFKAQAQTVRTFGVAVAALADKTVNPPPAGSVPSNMQYEFQTLADYTGAAGTLNQIFYDTHNRYVAATSGPNDFDNWTSWMATTIRHLRSDYQRNMQVTIKVPTFAEFVDGNRAAQVNVDSEGNPIYGSSGPGSLSGVLSSYTESAFPNDISHVSYQNPEYGSNFQLRIEWNAWPWQDSEWDGDNQAAIKGYTLEPEYHNYLRKLMVDLGNQYPLVQAPSPQDNSVLPKTNGSSSSPTGGPGSYGGAFDPGFSGGGANYGSGIPGAGGSSNGPGGPNPGVTYGSAYNPGPLPGGWPGSATKLAGYDPNPPGGSVAPPGATGFGGGPGGLGGVGPLGGGSFAGSGVPGGAVPGGGGLGGTAGGLGADGGLAAEAGLAGAAGAASRAMPMAPMAGAGGGKERGERQRAAWLAEDDDVWGAADDGGNPVL